MTHLAHGFLFCVLVVSLLGLAASSLFLAAGLWGLWEDWNGRR